MTVKYLVNKIATTDATVTEVDFIGGGRVILFTPTEDKTINSIELISVTP